MPAPSTRNSSRRGRRAPRAGHGYNASSSAALVLPVLDLDVCTVAIRVQFFVGDRILLAAEHFNLLPWTPTVPAAAGVGVSESRRGDDRS